MNTRTSTLTRHLRVVVSVTTLVVVGLGAEAAGQTPSGSEWRSGTVLAGFAGTAVASPETKLFAGTALGWEISPRLTVEGRGAWLPAGDGPTDFVAMLSAIVPVLQVERTVPFVSGGIGMYRATIDAAASEVPEFYQRRITAGSSRPVFQDFMVGFGGGVDVFATRHIAIRPDVQVLAVFAEGDRRWIPVYAVNLVYHFETHAIQ
jgi:hypothetical protein